MHRLILSVIMLSGLSFSFAVFLTPKLAWGSKQIESHQVSKNVVDLDIRLDVNGALVTHPQAHIKIGEKASITQMAVDGASSYTIDVTPHRDAKGVIDLDFAISRWIEGKIMVLSTPHLKMLMGRTARAESKAKDQSRLLLTVSTVR